MKTAISVDDRLLSETDRTAGEMGLSRSGLISIALEAYLRSRRQKEMTEQLNRVYGEGRDVAGKRTVKRMKTKFHSTIPERW
jgi:hypothetical protein